METKAITADPKVQIKSLLQHPKSRHGYLFTDVMDGELHFVKQVFNDAVGLLGERVQLARRLLGLGLPLATGHVQLPDHRAQVVDAALEDRPQPPTRDNALFTWAITCHQCFYKEHSKGLLCNYCLRSFFK